MYRQLSILSVMLVHLVACDENPQLNRTDSPDWTKSVVDDGARVGIMSSLIVDPSGAPHIVYLDEAEEGVKYYGPAGPQSITGSTGIASNAAETTTAGYWPSIALDSSNTPFIAFHDYDFSYQVEIQSVMGIQDPQEQQLALLDLFQRFSSGNNLSLYSGRTNQIYTLDWLGGQYTSIQLVDDSVALIGYCSYIWDGCRTQAAIESGCGLGQQEFQTRILYPKCNAAVMRVNLNVGFPLAAPAYLMSDPNDDIGVSFRLEKVDADTFVASFVDVSNMKLYFSLSNDAGQTWQTQQIAADAGRVGHFCSLAVYDRGDGTYRIAVPYYLTEGEYIRMSYTDDLGGSWTDTQVFAFRGKRLGEYPDIAFNSAGTAHISYYFASDPRSLQFAAMNPAGEFFHEQIDGTSSGSVGRYGSIGYDPISDTTYVSYYEKIAKSLMLASRVGSPAQ